MPSDRQVERHEIEPHHRAGVAIVVVAVFGGLLAVALIGLPREGTALPAVARYAMEVALPRWHTTEPVNEIVYGTRGFDTFGETFLLLAAVVSVSLITRTREARRGFIGEHEAGEEEQAEDDPHGGVGDRSAREAEKAESGPDPDWTTGPETPDDGVLGDRGPERAQGMSVVLRGGSRVVSPVLAVIGVYLVAWGYSPGGGFPAGAVIAGVVLVAYAVFGYPKVAKVVRPGVLEPIEVLGALVIIAVEVLGLILKGSFSASWLPLGQAETIQSGGILQAFSGGEFIEVATGLTLAIFALLGMRHDWAPDQDEEDEPGQGHEKQPSREGGRG